MTWATTIAREVYGLFVDDGLFALTIVGWVAAVWLGVSWLGLPPVGLAVLLFAGLALILLESATRRARR